MRLRPVAAVVVFGACARDPDPCAVGLPLTTIDAFLDAVEGLPEPTLTCALTAVERPLGLEATSDVFNTQPAQGPRSPRIFLRSETLTLTVVPVGEARNLLEFGEATDTPGLTLKAELAFPLAAPFDPAEAFTRVLAREGADETGCHVCHATEVPQGDGRYASTELRPPDGTTVPLEVLHDEHAACDVRADPERCAMFSALLDHGEVVSAPFDPTVSTRFGP